MLDGMELEAAIAAPVLETVLRADTRLFTTSLDQLRTTALPATLDGTELEAAIRVHALVTVLWVDIRR